MITIYGLKNCDTCRKALKWLAAEGVEFNFKDVRSDGFKRKDLESWKDAVGTDILLNKRGTTWRNLEDSQKEDLDEAGILDLIMEYPALLKRPVFVLSQKVLVGFAKNQQIELKSLI